MQTSAANTGSRPAGTFNYFALTIAFIFVMQAPATLAKLGVIPGDPQRYGGLTALGMFSPLLASSWLSWSEARGSGLRELYRQLLQWRAHPIWYLATLFGPPLLMAAGLFLVDTSGSRRYFYPPDQAPRVVALLLVPIVEELGWRGYALPRLLRRYSPLVASAIVGV